MSLSQINPSSCVSFFSDTKNKIATLAVVVALALAIIGFVNVVSALHSTSSQIGIIGQMDWRIGLSLAIIGTVTASGLVVRNGYHAYYSQPIEKREAPIEKREANEILENVILIHNNDLEPKRMQQYIKKSVYCTDVTSGKADVKGKKLVCIYQIPYHVSLAYNLDIASEIIEKCLEEKEVMVIIGGTRCSSSGLLEAFQNHAHLKKKGEATSKKLQALYEKDRLVSKIEPKWEFKLQAFLSSKGEG